MVKALRLAPATRTTSASPMSPSAVSVPKPPETPRYLSPSRRLSARAVTAVTAPRRSASSRSSGPAPARWAPRPARISGRFARQLAGHPPKAAVDVVRHHWCRCRGKFLVRSLEGREVVGDGNHDGGALGECVLHRPRDC